jgi:UDP-N-acetylmuramate dehydrogenase
MMTARRAHRLIDRLPTVRGRYSENVSLAGITWFRVGGPAEVLFRPADRDDLMSFLAQCPADVPIQPIGVGSNLLVRDGGIPGVVIRLGRGFTDIKQVVGEPVLIVGAATLDVKVALTARDCAIAGLEFLRGVPGTIGGALKMNAGAYGREIRDVLVAAEAVDRQGKLHPLSPVDLGLDYRHSEVPDDMVLIGATLKGHFGDKTAIAHRMTEINQAREASQPIRARTGGSTFANPEGRKAWELIDKAGCRGLMRGGAQVSTQHCNFLINTGAATAADLEGLGEEVRRRVQELTGETLRWEILRIGNYANGVKEPG